MEELNVFLREYDLLEESFQESEQDLSWFCFDGKIILCFYTLFITRTHTGQIGRAHV